MFLVPYDFVGLEEQTIVAEFTLCQVTSEDNVGNLYPGSFGPLLSHHFEECLSITYCSLDQVHPRCTFCWFFFGNTKVCSWFESEFVGSDCFSFFHKLSVISSIGDLGYSVSKGMRGALDEFRNDRIH